MWRTSFAWEEAARKEGRPSRSISSLLRNRPRLRNMKETPRRIWWWVEARRSVGGRRVVVVGVGGGCQGSSRSVSKSGLNYFLGTKFLGLVCGASYLKWIALLGRAEAES
jgi:hypothetical protein